MNGIEFIEQPTQNRNSHIPEEIDISPIEKVSTNNVFVKRKISTDKIKVSKNY